MKKVLVVLVVVLASFVFAGGSSNQTSFCTDTDEKDYFMKGQASNASGFFTDSCIDSSGYCENYVREWYCDGGDVLSTYFECPDGCSDGACIQETKCEDSDGGINFDEYGEIKIDDTTYEDYCVHYFADDYYELRERYCRADGSVGEIRHVCEFGCSGGVCLKKPDNNWCNQTDVNRDGKVNFADLGIVATNYGVVFPNNLTFSNQRADIDKNGVVDFADLSRLSSNYRRDDCAGL